MKKKKEEEEEEGNSCMKLGVRMDGLGDIR